jgi:hypothetical protein
MPLIPFSEHQNMISSFPRKRESRVEYADPGEGRRVTAFAVTSGMM